MNVKMGGFGSGRRYLERKNEITLDDCCSLNVNRMVKEGAIEDRMMKSGVWGWVDSETNKTLSSIRYQLNTFDKNDSYIQIAYKIKDTGEIRNYKIRLLRSYPPYGSVRFWFECPVTQKRVAKLYFMPDSDGFYLSRHASKLYYASQVRGKMDMAFARKWKALDKVDGSGWPIRPKGMHYKTFDAIMMKFLKENDNCKKMISEAMGGTNSVIKP